jgi:predicted RNase H-related nuclease YkuK (DUF458 family)
MKIDEVRQAIENSSSRSSIYIGGDSIRFKKNGRWFARYATVVIIHIDSCRGGKIFHFEDVQPDYGNMRMRLLTEVANTVNLALELLDSIGSRHLEIHLDLNKSPKHKSHVAVQEALGYVKGTLPNIQVEIKPNAFAASHAADHCVRGKPH